jgi:enoyl-CoA hydratase/carnithine racemase
MILMGGQKIGAEEALAFGLIERIVESERLIGVARGMAADTLVAAPAIARGIKDMCEEP